LNDLAHFHRNAWQNNTRRARIIEKLKPWAAAVAVVICYGIVGTMDYEDAVAMEQARTSAAVTQTASK
jgi:hypothetical protein